MTAISPDTTLARPTSGRRGTRPFLHYIGQSMLQTLRDWTFIAFVVAMPTTMYLFFAGIYGDQMAGSGVSVAAAMMITMATYGGLGAAMSAGNQIQIERSSGWFRQLMLTSLTPAQFLIGKIVTAVGVVVPSIGIVYVAGALRGVRLDAQVWAASFALIVATLMPMVLLGLVLGLWLRPAAAGAATTLTMLALSMLGGLWFPLDMMPSTMQTIGKLLPTHWAGQIGQWPVLGGDFPWRGVLVIGLWLLGLLLIAGLGYRRAVRTSRR